MGNNHAGWVGRDGAALLRQARACRRTARSDTFQHGLGQRQAAI